MSFDPEPYASGIRRLNDMERARRTRRVAEARSEASRLAEAIKRADPGVRDVILFGSLAGGEPADPEFDIDLAVSGGDSYLAMEIASSSRFDVDIVDLARLPEHVRSRILSQGVRL